MGAHRGVDAVRADQGVCLAGARGFAGAPVHETGCDPVAVLFESIEMVVPVQRPGAKALQHGVYKNRLEAAAMNGNLRPVVTRATSPRFREYRLAELVEPGVALQFDAAIEQLLFQAQTPILLYRVGQHIDPNAQFLAAAARFEHRDLHARFVQAQRRGQSTDPATGDHDVHAAGV